LNEGLSSLVLFIEEVRWVELTFNVMIHIDLAIELYLVACHFTDVHEPHLAIGQSFCPVNTSVVVIVDFSGRVDIKQFEIIHDEM
jgi:hypothetical protein